MREMTVANQKVKSIRPASRESAAEKLSAVLPVQGPNVSDIFFKMVNTMQYQIARSQVNIANVVIEPELRDFNWTEFHRAGEIIDKGMIAAEESLPKIRKLLPFHANFCEFPIRPGGQSTVS